MASRISDAKVPKKGPVFLPGKFVEHLENITDTAIPEKFNIQEPAFTRGIIDYLNERYKFWIKINEGQDAATLVLENREKKLK